LAGIDAAAWTRAILPVPKIGGALSLPGQRKTAIFVKAVRCLNSERPASLSGRNACRKGASVFWSQTQSLSAYALIEP
jgi:hypothetical protein